MNFDNTQELFDALAAPFPVEEISWRPGRTNEKWRKPDEPLKAEPFCYVDARAVMDRLDSVCEPDGWQCNYTPGVATSIVCNISIKFPVVYNGQQVGHEWVWKSDGAGATDVEAEKGTLSDAFKRAAVRWGVARYLYELKAPSVVLNERKAIAKAQTDALNNFYVEYVRKIQPVIGVNAYRQAYRLLIGTINTVAVSELAAYEHANEAMIAGLPGAMRDHVLNTIRKRKAA